MIRSYIMGDTEDTEVVQETYLPIPSKISNDTELECDKVKIKLQVAIIKTQNTLPVPAQNVYDFLFRQLVIFVQKFRSLIHYETIYSLYFLRAYFNKQKGKLLILFNKYIHIKLYFLLL